MLGVDGNNRPFDFLKFKKQDQVSTPGEIIKVIIDFVFLDFKISIPYKRILYITFEVSILDRTLVCILHLWIMNDNVCRSIAYKSLVIT